MLKDLYRHITPRYASYWYDIGVYLDFKTEQLNVIKANHPGDTKSCCKELWREWMTACPNATWQDLFDAIYYLDSYSLETAGNIRIDRQTCSCS